MLNTEKDFSLLAEMSVPVKRAAYSDRTAWIMAILAELAYIPFEEESEELISGLARDLADLNNQETIVERLVEFRNTLALVGAVPAAQDTNIVLRTALGHGGFRLVGVFHNAGTDTQGFVAERRDDDGTGMAVICFRGTTSPHDWMTNLTISSRAIQDPSTGCDIGTMHQGFHDAYCSVHKRISGLLTDLHDLPVYVTGHSLGGALAVVCTWYQSSQRLGACYTFGAPRVGDQGLIDRFKTPIYRIVNGPDPITLVPPAGVALKIAKGIIRVLGVLLPFWGWAAWITEKLIRSQKFRHYGYMRYLTLAEPGRKRDYPTLRVEFALSTYNRLKRFIGLRTSGRARRIGTYHSMAHYRSKLRAHALRANPVQDQPDHGPTPCSD